MPQSNIYIVNIESFDMAHGNFSNELEILCDCAKFMLVNYDFPYYINEYPFYLINIST